MMISLLMFFLETTENAMFNHADVGALKSHHSQENTNSFDDNLVIIYNRVPKTGSTSFVNLAYDLCKKNQFYVLHINITANMHVLSLSNQVSNTQSRHNHSVDLLNAFGEFDYIRVICFAFQISFVRNITAWNEMKPALYHGHMAYLDFSK